jgi:ADP-ribosyl-[dinitrogen reductase] hydrolase
MIVQLYLYGVAIGDALGFPYQFVPREERKRYPVIEMGKYKDEQGKVRHLTEEDTGLWSDDTSLTLCLAESLLNGFDLKDQAKRFVAWLEDGYLSALEDAFDVGLQTSAQLSLVSDILRNGTYTELEYLANDEDEDSNGNGSLMRILPLIMYIKGMDINAQFDLIRKASSLTHPHIRSALCCFYYLRMAEYIINQHGLTETYKLARKDTLGIMQQMQVPEFEFRAMHRLLHEDIGTLEEDKINSDGYVVSSLEASIWCLLTTDSYKASVLKAVNLGYDTDTTAAITGGLAALHYGYDSIPSDWIALLKKPEIFENIISRYANIAE